jgi:DNA-binding NarL/FixJ family response regulator
MEPPRESDPALPSPEELLHRRRAVGIQLSHWRLLLCTGKLPYGLLMLAQLLDSPDGEPPQRLLGICRRGADGLALLPAEAGDVLLLCQEFLGDGPALPMLREVLRRPSPPTVLLSLGTPHRVAIRDALAVGVQGVISQRNVGRGVVLEALTHLAAGGVYLDSDCQAGLYADGPASAELTAREVEILALVAEGCTNRRIGERLQIAEVTARDHVQHILAKLQVVDRTAAAVTGLRLGYLPSGPG